MIPERRCLIMSIDELEAQALKPEPRRTCSGVTTDSQINAHVRSLIAENA